MKNINEDMSESNNNLPKESVEPKGFLLLDMAMVIISS